LGPIRLVVGALTLFIRNSFCVFQGSMLDF
jgi:hypothetical protein